MLFNSLSFLVFFPIVLLVYFVIPKKIRYIWLLVTSYYFYMCWNPKYVLLLAASTIVTYLCSILLKCWQGKTRLKKMTVAMSLLINFGILFLFKYFDFAWDTLTRVMTKVHITVPEVTFGWLLPVGISFYIFQAVGYTIDVYREKIIPEKNLLKYALFVSFFPQLVAGPIERSSNLLSQIQRVHTIKLWDFDRVQKGALIMLYGYMMKMILADRAAIYVDAVFSPELFTTYGGFTVAIAAVLFTLQIYCDFAGYTYIAIGAAKVMGFELMDNFHTPYLAEDIKDFWARWHISLTTWFRDYLYIPLGGSRKGTVRKYINILIIFVVSGLWHGASWHYVIWGAMHGIMRVFGEATKGIRDNIWKLTRINTKTLFMKCFRIAFTFILVTIAWIFFRAESFSQAIIIIKNMVTVWNPWVLFDESLFVLGLDAKEWNVLLLAILGLLLVDICQYKKVNLPELVAKQNLLFKWLFFYAGIMLIVIFGVYGANFNAGQFIYFQF